MIIKKIPAGPPAALIRCSVSSTSTPRVVTSPDLKGGILMRFTVPLLAVLSIDGTVRSAEPGAEVPDTLAQEYQKSLKESGQISPNFRDVKTDAERKQAVEATDKFTRRFVMLFFFSSRRRHTICLSDWSSDVCSSD